MKATAKRHWNDREDNTSKLNAHLSITLTKKDSLRPGVNSTLKMTNPTHPGLLAKKVCFISSLCPSCRCLHLVGRPVMPAKHDTLVRPFAEVKWPFSDSV